MPTLPKYQAAWAKHAGSLKGGRLVVPWPARQRSVAMSMQAHIGKHPDRRVRARKSGLGAYRLNLRVGDMPRGSVEQALNRFFDRRDLLKTDADQVL